MKKLLGFTLISLPFIAVLGITIQVYGLGIISISLGASVLIVGVVALGMYLIAE